MVMLFKITTFFSAHLRLSRKKLETIITNSIFSNIKLN
ncbi:MAG: hypothetical protein JWR38_2170 [Mucilaginibacter sp.]|nr:hypothetical protein [Mucilaginibacter sp.]